MGEYRVSPGGILIPKKHKPHPTAFDFFCGCGGMSLGIIAAGFEVVGAMDNDPSAARTYLHNLGAYPLRLHYTSDKHQEGLYKYFQKLLPKGKDIEGFQVSGSGWIQAEREHKGNHWPPVKDFWFGDIQDVTGAEILDTLAMSPGELDLVCGGPPCQGFSISNTNRNPDDPRNKLLFEMARLILELQPKTIVVENVPQMLEMVTAEGVPVVDQFCRILSDGDFAPYKSLCKAMGIHKKKSRKLNAAVRAPSKSAKKNTNQTSLFD